MIIEAEADREVTPNGEITQLLHRWATSPTANIHQPSIMFSWAPFFRLLFITIGGSPKYERLRQEECSRLVGL